MPCQLSPNIIESFPLLKPISEANVMKANELLPHSLGADVPFVFRIRVDFLKEQFVL